MSSFLLRVVLPLVAGLAIASTVPAQEGNRLPAVAPDGRSVAFVSTRDGNAEIYRLDLESGRVTRLTTHEATDGHPAWSPDGRRLAFESDRDGTNAVWVMQADGPGARRLTPEGSSAMSPAWSPDGTRIAVAMGTMPSLDVWTLGPDGSDATRLTNGDGMKYWPAWSPDGERLAWVRLVLGPEGPDRARSGIVVARSDGSEPALVLADVDGIHETPVWSPDGDRIAFQTRRGERFDLFTMKPDGSDVVRLTDTATDEEVPRFSPDGTRLFFQSNRTGRWEVWEMAADGSDPERRTGP